MRWIDTPVSRDPRWNLALEEYCLLHLDPGEDCFLCYVNDPAVVIGRNQNIFAEADPAFCRRRRLPVLRRISGGGAVYHDRGNLNYAFITQEVRLTVGRFARFAAPVIAALEAVGVRAALNGRNDLVCDGRKISGTAQFARGRRLLSHGTLLYEADLETLGAALKGAPEIIGSRGRPSVRSPVRNVRERLSAPMTIEDFRQHLLEHALGPRRRRKSLRLTADAQAAVRRLADRKYGTWDWNTGRSPTCWARWRCTAGGETAALVLEVEGGRVRAVRTPSGGAAARRLAAAAEEVWAGMRYAPESLTQALAGPTAAGAAVTAAPVAVGRPAPRGGDG